MAEHRLIWNPVSKMYECDCCEQAFAPEFTYPANSMEQVEILMAEFPIDPGDKYVIVNDRASPTSS